MEYLQNASRVEVEQDGAGRLDSSTRNVNHENMARSPFDVGRRNQVDDGYSSDGGSSFCSDASEVEALRQRSRLIEEGERSLSYYALERTCERTGIKKNAHITLASDSMSIRQESDRIENEVAVRRSIKFQRRALLTMSSGVEYLHNKSPLLKGRLTGWGECMLDSIDDYDVVFRRLHEKHGPKIANGRPSKEMEPEMELLYMVAYNAFTFTVSQSIANLTTSFPAGETPDAEEAISTMRDRMQEAKTDSDRVRMFSSDAPPAIGPNKVKTKTGKKGERVIQL